MPIQSHTALAPSLPVDGDNDRIARPRVTNARRAFPESKGKGSQNSAELPVASQSGKGKRKAASPLRHTDGKKPRGGRIVGAANYSPEDLDALFDILEERLPLGGNAWNSVGDEFNVWAKENNRHARTSKSLELKFKQVSIQSSFTESYADCSKTACENYEANRRR